MQWAENNTEIQGKEKAPASPPPEVERVSHTLSIQQVPSMNCLRQSKAFESSRKKETHVQKKETFSIPKTNLCI